MKNHPNGWPYGTVRRAPEGFAHAILLDQGDIAETWQIIDLYGCMHGMGGTLETDEGVADWQIVYVPMDSEEWANKRKLPDSMMRPVKFDMSLDDRLTPMNLVPMTEEDEAKDVW